MLQNLIFTTHVQVDITIIVLVYSLWRELAFLNKLRENHDVRIRMEGVKQQCQPRINDTNPDPHIDPSDTRVLLLHNASTV